MSEGRGSRTAMFSFDPADVEADERARFKAANRKAFEAADYMPPETKSVPSPDPARGRPAVPKVPSFRRPRGRPAGERQYRISFKSTELHLAALYGIAGQGELVGVFERAVELLAIEIARSGRYDGRALDDEARAAVEALVRQVSS